MGNSSVPNVWTSLEKARGALTAEISNLSTSKIEKVRNGCIGNLNISQFKRFALRVNLGMLL